MSKGWKKGVKNPVPMTWGAKSIQLKSMAALTDEYSGHIYPNQSLECTKCGSMRREILPGGKIRKCKKCGYIWGGSVAAIQEAQRAFEEALRYDPDKSVQASKSKKLYGKNPQAAKEHQDLIVEIKGLLKKLGWRICDYKLYVEGKSTGAHSLRNMGIPRLKDMLATLKGKVSV